MAFCTSCGAQVNGAFCVQCGTPVKTAGAPVAAPPPPPQPVPAGPAAPVVKSGTSPIVWIIAIIGGLIVLGGIAIIGAGYFFFHKAKQFADNPGYAAAKTILALTPNLTEVSHDDNAGTITIRDDKSGEVMTWNFDDIKNGKFRISAKDNKGQTATMEFGAGASSKLPSWVPVYPGTNPSTTFSVTANSTDGSGGGGNFTFTTSDPVSKVVDFYKEKFDSLGLKANLSMSANDGQMLSGTDDVSKRHLTVLVGPSGGQTTVNVTFGGKD